MNILSREEVHVHRNYRYVIGSLFLIAVLAAPLTLTGAPRQQEDRREEEHHRDGDRNRFYDHEHRDYHNWNDNEDRSYRVYLGERHREYHPFVKLRVSQQRAYWNWRHHHPDHDRDGR